MLAVLYYYGSVSVQYLYLLSVSRAHATSHRFWMLRTLYIAVLRHGVLVVRRHHRAIVQS